MSKTFQPLRPVQPSKWIRLPSGRFVNLALVTDISPNGVAMFYAMMSTNAYGNETPYSTENYPQDAAALLAYMEQHVVTLTALPAAPISTEEELDRR